MKLPVIDFHLPLQSYKNYSFSIEIKFINQLVLKVNPTVIDVHKYKNNSTNTGDSKVNPKLTLKHIFYSSWMNNEYQISQKFPGEIVTLIIEPLKYLLKLDCFKDGEDIFGETKTYESERKIKIGESLLKELKNHLKVGNENKVAFIDDYKYDLDSVFCHEDGNISTKSPLFNTLSRMVKKAGISLS